MAADAEGWAARPTLSAEISRRMVDAAVSQAAAMSVPVTIVMVDESDPAAVASFAARSGLALIGGGLPLVTGGGWRGRSGWPGR
jgi:hypothetical protein